MNDNAERHDPEKKSGRWLRKIATLCKEQQFGEGSDDGWIRTVLLPDAQSPLDASVREALRLSAHTLGAIRKVGGSGSGESRQGETR